MHGPLRLTASPAGRATRIAAGAALLGTALIPRRKNWGLAALGIISLSMGATDSCLLGPVNGLPFNGLAMRRASRPAPPL